MPSFSKKEITVFSYGDSNDISTWSNVLYLFTKTLEEKGYKLHRVDISPNKIINRLFNTISYLIFKRFLRRKACPEFHRTWLHRFITYQRIKRATKLYPNAQLNLFLSFAFYNKYSNRPNILWCDWTDRIVIERLEREPRFYERVSLRHEDNIMQKADRVYTMFPKCKEHMEELYGRKVIYLNRNVVNTVYNGDFDIEKNIETRYASNKILFIGNIRYIGAAKELVKAFEILKKDNCGLELHIIGMTKEQMNVNDDNIHCYGYLKKNINGECDLYYSLLHSCKVFVNPAQQWGGYSSSIEAMYYGTPIIIAPYNDFVCEFGTDINFGRYTNNKEELHKTINSILNSDQEKYKAMCYNAYNRVSDYTWSNYINEFLESLKKENIIN